MSDSPDRSPFQLFLPLSSDEYERLRADIEANGIRDPIIRDADTGDLLDGHHRLRVASELGIDCPSVTVACGSDDERRAFVLRVNFNRRHLSPEQRGEVRKQQQKVARGLNAAGLTQEQIAGRLGVAQRTVSGWLISNSKGANANKRDLRVKLKQEHQEEIAARVAEGEPQQQIAADFGISQGRVSQVVKKVARQHAPATSAASSLLDIRYGDFRSVLADVTDIDLILTDPPYGYEHVADYADLAAWASTALKPGGSLIAYSGQGALPEVLDAMRPHLRYWWTLALSHQHGGQQFPGKFVIVEWKPLLWFVKDYRRGRDYVADQVRGSKPRKELHEWAQGVEEVAYLIEQLTDPGDLVVDPFAGSGSFGEAATRLGRGFIGAEINP